VRFGLTLPVECVETEQLILPSSLKIMQFRNLRGGTRIASAVRVGLRTLRSETRSLEFMQAEALEDEVVFRRLFALRIQKQAQVPRYSWL
jgi:hypothetical protein